MRYVPLLLFLVSVAAHANVAAGESTDLQIHLKPNVGLKADLKDVLKATVGHSLASAFVAGVGAVSVCVAAFPFLVQDNVFARKLTVMCASVGAFLGFAAYYFKNFEIDLSQKEFNARIDVAAKDLANKRTTKECQDRSLLIKEAQNSADGTGQPVHIVVEPVNIHPTVHERQKAFTQMCKNVESMPARFYGLCCSFAIAAAAKYLYCR